MEDHEANNDNTRSFVPITEGTMISHYKIIEKIGAGGMGEVYLAEDTKLDRKVALKFLPPHLCQDEDCRARFKREAQAAAKLNHPNIVTIYEVGDHKGRPYFAMEHVAGNPLREFSRMGELGIERVIELAIQICDGLEAAHSEKITHRDIKPSNIIIDSHGRAKILDFGLAAVQGQEHLTQTGSTLGTVRYMSPEQVEGKNIDHRSDLFSLGIVLYELLTGKTPFNRDNDVAIGQAIISATPEPLAKYRANIPEELQRIVSKLLEKDTSHRYQHADGVFSDFKRLIYGSSQFGYSSITTPKPKKTWLVAGITASVMIVVVAIMYSIGPINKEHRTSNEVPMIAVLPFENLGSSDDEYFADGITDEITCRLAKIKDLRVISRTSAMQYKDTDKGLQQIGKELSVDYVLEGTIRWDKSGDKNMVRITPQLIKVSDDFHVWAENYERELTQIFAVQADIAEHIVTALGFTLLENQADTEIDQPTENMAAYDFYLRAKDFLNHGFDIKNMKSAIEMLHRAIDLDPNFAAAYAKLSFAHLNLYFWYGLMTELEPAINALNKGISIDPDLPEIQLTLGAYYTMHELDYQKATETFEKVRMAIGYSSELYQQMSYLAKRQGKWDQALLYARKALEFDPRSALQCYELASALTELRDYTEADWYYNKAIALSPASHEFYYYKILNLLLWRGDTDEVRREIESATDFIDPVEVMLLGYEVGLGTLGLWRFNLLDNDLETISRKFSEQFYGPRIHAYYMSQAQIYDLFNDEKMAAVYNDSARVYLESEVETYPEDFHYRSELALAYMFLGRSEDAMREGLRAKELMSIDLCHW